MYGVFYFSVGVGCRKKPKFIFRGEPAPSTRDIRPVLKLIVEFYGKIILYAD